MLSMPPQIACYGCFNCFLFILCSLLLFCSVKILGMLPQIARYGCLNCFLFILCSSLLTYSIKMLGMPPKIAPTSQLIHLSSCCNCALKLRQLMGLCTPSNLFNLHFHTCKTPPAALSSFTAHLYPAEYYNCTL